MTVLTFGRRPCDERAMTRVHRRALAGSVGVLYRRLITPERITHIG